ILLKILPNGIKSMFSANIFGNLVQVLWSLLGLVHLLLSFIIRITRRLKKLLVSKLEERILFEKKHITQKVSQSFYLTNQKALICFQVASDGEFEQVRWLAMEIVGNSEKIEIIFTSPSVEHRILKLYSEYTTQVRYLRTPIATISTKDLSHWIT